MGGELCADGDCFFVPVVYAAGFLLMIRLADGMQRFVVIGCGDEFDDITTILVKQGPGVGEQGQLGRGPWKL